MESNAAKVASWVFTEVWEPFNTECYFFGVDGGTINQTYIFKEININLCLIAYIQINWWTIDLNVKHKPIKRLEENVGETFVK